MEEQERKEEVEELQQADGEASTPQETVEIEEVDIAKGVVTPEETREILEGHYYTIKQLAESLDYSNAWIRWMCQDGRIHAMKPTGGQWRIPESEVNRVVKEGIPPLPRTKKTVEEPTRIEVPAELEPKVVPRRKQKEEEETAEGKNPYWPLPFILKGK